MVKELCKAETSKVKAVGPCRIGDMIVYLTCELGGGGEEKESGGATRLGRGFGLRWLGLSYVSALFSAFLQLHCF